MFFIGTAFTTRFSQGTVGRQNTAYTLAAVGILGWWLWNPGLPDVVAGSEGSPETQGDASVSRVGAATNSPAKLLPMSLGANATNGQTQTQHQLPPSALQEQRGRVIQQITKALSAPITFYGKVVDQNENPVANVDVSYSVVDKFYAPGSDYHGTSDQIGLFSITGIKGSDLTVGVSKTGYYSIKDKSVSYFAYASEPHSGSKSSPTRDDPAVFVLWKMGDTEPLVEVSSRQFTVSGDGRPTNINLENGKSGMSGSCVLTIESWLGDTQRERFGWRYRLGVPGGGLRKRTNWFDFEAPDDGYSSSIDVNGPTESETWSGEREAEYFARFPNGKYARFSISFYPGKRNFVVLESYLNPSPGHRNLEFDKTKTIKPTR